MTQNVAPGETKSPVEQVLDRIARLDSRLGVGVGAVKERARLAARLDELTAGSSR
jgi:hypothetical protein